MKRLIPITFFLFTFFTSSAQFENIDLSKYKLPEIKRHQLDFGLQYSSNYQRDSRGNSNRSYPDFFDFNLNNNLNANYSYYLNSDKIQMEGRINLSTEIELDWQKIDKTNFDKNDDYRFILNTWLDRRMYFNGEDKWFFLWSPSLYVNSYSYYNKEESDYSVSKSDRHFSRNLDFQPGIRLGGGIGRIEPVGDLRRAIYILDDLFENDRLNRLPNENEIVQLADKVAQLRNQRFFDSRLRRIYEIKSLD